MDEMFANSVNEEIALWHSLKKNEGWMVFKKLIRYRQASLIKKTLNLMRQQKIVEAQDSRAGYDELGKLLSLVDDRMEALKTESNKEDE